MTAGELIDLLQDFRRETFELLMARQKNARSVAAYDANNAYQQVLGRQDVHLRWVEDAIADLGGAVTETAGNDGASSTDPGRKDGLQRILESDLNSQRSFITRWQTRVPTVANARHRKMLELILGEMMEHLRVFQQALEGRTDLLGRHADGKELRGEVLPARPAQ